MGTRATPEALERLLKSKGVPANCYCLSENDELDGQELPLGAALEQVVGYGMGTFISCLPGRLAYFEGEVARERYILVRPAV